MNSSNFLNQDLVNNTTSARPPLKCPGNLETIEAYTKRLDSAYFYTMAGIIPLGLLCNLFSLLIFTLSKSLRRTTTARYLAALACADSLFLVGDLGRWISTPGMGLGFEFIHKYDLLCKLSHSLRYGGKLVSAWIIVAIVLERLITVTLPLRVSSISTSLRARCLIILIYIIGFSLGLYPFWTVSVRSVRKHKEKGFYRCVITKGQEFAYKTWGTGVLRIGTLGVPGVIITIATIIIVVHLFRAARARRRQFEGQPNKPRLSSCLAQLDTSSSEVMGHSLAQLNKPACVQGMSETVKTRGSPTRFHGNCRVLPRFNIRTTEEKKTDVSPNRVKCDNVEHSGVKCMDLNGMTCDSTQQNRNEVMRTNIHHRTGSVDRYNHDDDNDDDDDDEGDKRSKRRYVTSSLKERKRMTEENLILLKEGVMKQDNRGKVHRGDSDKRGVRPNSTDERLVLLDNSYDNRAVSVVESSHNIAQDNNSVVSGDSGMCNDTCNDINNGTCNDTQNDTLNAVNNDTHNDVKKETHNEIKSDTNKGTDNHTNKDTRSDTNKDTDNIPGKTTEEVRQHEVKNSNTESVRESSRTSFSAVSPRLPEHRISLQGGAKILQGGARGSQAGGRIGGRVGGKASHAERQLSGMLIGVCLAFVLLRLPYTITYYVQEEIKKVDACFTVPSWPQFWMTLSVKLADCVASSNYLANFFLYCLCGSYFRQQIVVVFTRRKRPGSQATGGSRSSPGRPSDRYRLIQSRRSSDRTGSTVLGGSIGRLSTDGGLQGWLSGEGDRWRRWNVVKWRWSGSYGGERVTASVGEVTKSSVPPARLSLV